MKEAMLGAEADPLGTVLRLKILPHGSGWIIQSHPQKEQ